MSFQMSNVFRDRCDIEKLQILFAILFWCQTEFVKLEGKDLKPHI